EAGVDPFTGYGRISAHSAVAEVLAGHIPPEADVTKPIWFQLLDPQRDGAFTVEGRLAAQRAAGGYTYRVQIGYGIQPTEADFIDLVPFGATHTTPLQGVLATITPADIPAPTADQIARRQNQLPDVTSDYDQFTYTIRVQVRDQPGNQLGEDRRTIFLHHDRRPAGRDPRLGRDRRHRRRRLPRRGGGGHGGQGVRLESPGRPEARLPGARELRVLDEAGFREGQSQPRRSRHHRLAGARRPRRRRWPGRHCRRQRPPP